MAPLRAELAPLLARVRLARRQRSGGVRVHGGTLGARPVLCLATGDGRESAEAGVRELLARYRIDRLVILGVAGGLSRDLAPGDLLLARQVLASEGAAPAPDPAWLQRAAAVGSARLGTLRLGTLWSADRILVTAAEKAALGRQIAPGEPAAVDLETAACARLAAAAGIPYLAVRAISDTADETLPLDFNRWRDARGRVRQAAVALHAVLHPGVIGDLRRLQQRVRLGAERLAEFVTALLAEPKV